MSLQVDGGLSRRRETGVYGTRIKIVAYLDYDDEAQAWQEFNRVLSQQSPLEDAHSVAPDSPITHGYGLAPNETLYNPPGWGSSVKVKMNTDRALGDTVEVSFQGGALQKVKALKKFYDYMFTQNRVFVS